MRVKPAEGRAIRDPGTYKLLAKDGAEVQPSQFWTRRLRDGDVVEVKSADASQPAATAPVETPPAPTEPPAHQSHHHRTKGA